MTLPSAPRHCAQHSQPFLCHADPQYLSENPRRNPGQFCQIIVGLYLQYYECHPSTPVRVAQIEDHPIHLEILGSGAHPSSIPKPRSHGCLLRGEIHADSAYGHRSCCIRGAQSSSVRGTLCQRARILLFSESCSTRRSCIFSRWTNGERSSTGNLVQYVIAQERLTQRVMGYLQSLADLNPRIAIGRPLRPDQERRIHRLVNPLPPIEEECAPVPEAFSQDPVFLPFSL